MENWPNTHTKINFFISNDLNSNISSDEINLTSHIVKFVVLFPGSSFVIDFEEEN